MEDQTLNKDPNLVDRLEQIVKGRYYGYTVDGNHSRDLDDAIWMNGSSDGYVVHVYIADVAGAVPADSDIDKRAYALTATRYMRHRNDPMLPHTLSEDALTLMPDRPRRCIAFKITLNNDLAVTGVSIERARFKNDRRHTHQFVDGILNDSSHVEHGMWTGYFEFAQKLLLRRRRSGALLFYDLDRGLYTDEDGTISKRQPGVYFRPHVIVQEFMILANTAVTEFLRAQGVALLYRNHSTLENESIESIYGQLKASPELLLQLKSRLAKFAGRAEYGSDCAGHHALGLESYAHWTSPIRRYADLVNHRQLASWLDGDLPQYNADDLQSIATHINAVQARLRNDNEHRDRTKAKVIGSDLASLNRAPHFEISYLIKLIARAEIELTADRAAAILQRAQSDSKQPLRSADKTRILYSTVGNEQDRWREIQSAVLLNMSPTEMIHIAGQVSDLTALAVGTRTQTQQNTSRSQTTIKLNDGKMSTVVSSWKSSATAAMSQSLAIAEATRVLTRSKIMPNFESSQDLIMPTTNHKGALMERCQKHKWPHPVFSHTSSGPPHLPVFECSVTMVAGDKPLSAKSQGASKKQAEQLACQDLLKQLGDQPTASTGTANSIPSAPSNPISDLNQRCQTNGWAAAVYESQRSGADHELRFTMTCRLTTDKGSFESTSEPFPSKKQAKTDAARKLVESLDRVAPKPSPRIGGFLN